MVGHERFELPISWTQTKSLTKFGQCPIWWLLRELNPRRFGLQPNALPTELKSLIIGASPETRTLEYYLSLRAATH